MYEVKFKVGNVYCSKDADGDIDSMLPYMVVKRTKKFVTFRYFYGGDEFRRKVKVVHNNVDTECAMDETGDKNSLIYADIEREVLSFIDGKYMMLGNVINNAED